MGLFPQQSCRNSYLSHICFEGVPEPLSAATARWWNPDCRLIQTPSESGTMKVFITIITATLMALSAVGQNTTTGGADQQPQYVQGPRGGCYQITKNGGKKSVDRAHCSSSAQNAPSQASAPPKTSPSKPETTGSAQRDATGGSQSAPSGSETKVVKGNRTYIKGPKGGCYYVTASGRKEYVDRSMCQ